MTRAEAHAAYQALMKYYPLTLDDLPGEEWLPVPDFDKYQVSNFGRVKSFNGLWIATTILKPAFTHTGYLRVTLRRSGKAKKFSVHRLVALTFIPNPKGKPQVNHIDGCKFNNHVSNLEWATVFENIRHAYDNGLIIAQQGEEHHGAKLTNEQVLYIRANPDNLTGEQLADRLGLDKRTISNVQLGRTFKYAGGTIRQSKLPRVPNEIRKQIRTEYIKGSRKFGSIALAKKYGFDYSTILRIIYKND